MTRKEIKSKTINQSNDASCFNCGPSYNRSAHNKKAKRNSSKKLRVALKKDMDINETYQ